MSLSDAETTELPVIDQRLIRLAQLETDVRILRQLQERFRVRRSVTALRELKTQERAIDALLTELGAAND